MNVIKNLREPSVRNLPAMLNVAEKNLNTLLGRKIVVMDKQECIFLKMDDIAYAEANGAYTDVYLINGKKMVVCKNLKAFSARLPDDEFLRVHKSYIINVHCISKYVKSDGGYIILDNGKEVPVSVRKRDVISYLVEALAL